MNYQKKTTSLSTPEEEQGSFSSQHTSLSNSERIAKMSSSSSTKPKTLWGTMTLIVNGSLEQAKQEAHAVANDGRDAQDLKTVNVAGDLWTLAHLFQDIQYHVSTSNFPAVQNQTASAEHLIQRVIGSIPVLQVLGDRLLLATRGYTKQAEQGIQSHSSVSLESFTTEFKNESVLTIPNKEDIPTTETQQSSQTGVLNALFGLVTDGHLFQAKLRAHELANNARKQQDIKSAEAAGKIWSIAQSCTEIQLLLKERTYAPVKEKAKQAADQARGLMAAGDISNDMGEKFLKIAAGYWAMADKMLVEQRPAQNTAKGSAAANAQKSATVDQHRLPHPNSGAYCGVATLMMFFEANGQDANNTQEMNRIASQVYINGNGSDVGLMGNLMRQRGFASAKATRTGGMKELLDTLDKGQPVPFGVTHSEGTIIKLNSAGSRRYPHARVGDYHSKVFGSAGHWVLVTGYEGSRENPTHFIVNDPDLGGQLRITKTRLTRMGVREGQFYQITQ